jgi:hypothetical protein
MAYLILVALDRFSAKSVRALLDKAWELTDSASYPEKVRQMILAPILRQILGELHDVCTSDCPRISTRPITLDEREIEAYWDQLRLPADELARPKDSRILVIEWHDTPCKVGFELNREHRCPFLTDDEEERID